MDRSLDRKGEREGNRKSDSMSVNFIIISTPKEFIYYSGS